MTADRKLRCLRLVLSKRGKNQCESEQLPGYDYCAAHLADAYRQYLEATGQIVPEGDGTQ